MHIFLNKNIYFQGAFIGLSSCYMNTKCALNGFDRPLLLRDRHRTNYYVH